MANSADSPEKILGLKKGTGFYVTEDNIAHATAARQARHRMGQGTATPADYDLVNGREALLKKAVEEKGSA
jgi:hypothetical protein